MRIVLLELIVHQEARIHDILQVDCLHDMFSFSEVRHCALIQAAKYSCNLWAVSNYQKLHVTMPDMSKTIQAIMITSHHSHVNPTFIRVCQSSSRLLKHFTFTVEVCLPILYAGSICLICLTSCYP
jgi:hypothetical protein